MTATPIRAKLIPDGPETTTFGIFIGGDRRVLPYAAIWICVTVDSFTGARVWFDDGTDVFIHTGRWHPGGGDVGVDLDRWFPGVGL